MESLLTQTLIIHIIRTNKIPFVQSRASWPLAVMSAIVVAIGIGLPFSPLGRYLGFTSLPLLYWPLLAGTVLGYGLLTWLYEWGACVSDYPTPTQSQSPFRRTVHRASLRTVKTTRRSRSVCDSWRRTSTGTLPDSMGGMLALRLSARNLQRMWRRMPALLAMKVSSRKVPSLKRKRNERETARPRALRVERRSRPRWSPRRYQPRLPQRQNGSAGVPPRGSRRAFRGTIRPADQGQ